MDYHYGKHHVAYCNNYNSLMPKYHEAMEKHDHELAKSILPKVEFNYGGYWNHDQYWKNLVGVEKGGKV